MTKWTRITIAVLETSIVKSNQIFGEEVFKNINYQNADGNTFSVISGLFDQEQTQYVIENFSNVVIDDNPVNALKALNLLPIQEDSDA